MSETREKTVSLEVSKPGFREVSIKGISSMNDPHEDCVITVYNCSDANEASQKAGRFIEAIMKLDSESELGIVKIEEVGEP